MIDLAPAPAHRSARPGLPRTRTTFLLSPAHAGGRRAALLLREGAGFALARRLRSARGARLGDVYTFLSGLYFRGKLAYAQTWARPGRGGVLVIVPGRGLQPPAARVTLDDLRAIAAVPVDAAEPRYVEPLVRDARTLAAGRRGHRVVLLGSIASGKYVEVLSPVLGDSLHFPRAFAGRGDMSRGGLMLRCVAAGEELEYVTLQGAPRHGARPPRLTPRPKIRRAGSPSRSR